MRQDPHAEEIDLLRLFMRGTKLVWRVVKASVTDAGEFPLAATVPSRLGEATGEADVNALKARVAKMERVAKEGIAVDAKCSGSELA